MNALADAPCPRQCENGMIWVTGEFMSQCPTCKGTGVAPPAAVRCDAVACLWPWVRTNRCELLMGHKGQHQEDRATWSHSSGLSQPAAVPEPDICPLDVDELAIREDYRAKGKLESGFFPLIAYDLVQSGYPTPTRGVMVPRIYGGTNANGQLLSSDGQWCCVADVKLLLAAQSAQRDALAGLVEEMSKLGGLYT